MIPPSKLAHSVERLRNYLSATGLCKAETAKGKRYKEQLDLQIPFPHA